LASFVVVLDRLVVRDSAMSFWRRFKSSNRSKTASEVADLVERFLDGRSSYPQEWNDFVDGSQRDKAVEVYRKRCYDLDPRVNRPGDPDPEAVAELRSMIGRLRQSHIAAEPR
jgi:hypothetical protein